MVRVSLGCEAESQAKACSLYINLLGFSVCSPSQIPPANKEVTQHLYLCRTISGIPCIRPGKMFQAEFYKSSDDRAEVREWTVLPMH